MITVQLRNGDKVGTVTFPELDRILEYTVQDMGGRVDSDIKFTLDHVLDPEELKYLEGTVVDLDEMNFLAKRMDSFDEREMRSFRAAVDQDRPVRNTKNKPQSFRTYHTVTHGSEKARSDG